MLSSLFWYPLSVTHCLLADVAPTPTSCLNCGRTRRRRCHFRGTWCRLQQRPTHCQPPPSPSRHTGRLSARAVPGSCVRWQAACARSESGASFCTTVTRTSSTYSSSLFIAASSIWICRNCPRKPSQTFSSLPIGNAKGLESYFYHITQRLRMIFIQNSFDFYFLFLNYNSLTSKSIRKYTLYVFFTLSISDIRIT